MPSRRVLRSPLRRDYDEALVRLLDPISNAAFDVGRRIPNAPWREQLSEVVDSAAKHGAGHRHDASMSSNAPHASAIVRTLNSAATLGACLESLKRQTMPPEIIVVDSGSSDATMAIAFQLADRIVQIARDSFSYGRALNRGAEVAVAPVHFAVSSHCVIPRRDWIERSLSYYKDPGRRGNEWTTD